MGKVATSLVGSRFGRLIVTERIGAKNSQPFWRCKCDCGGTKETSSSCLKSGDTKSCGCLNSEVAKATRTSHGMTRTVEYAAWAHMIQRCTDENESNYHNYGGRGIEVCASWRKFENFYADMSDRPNGMTLDRVNTNGNYEPSNCRWATPKTQANNRRNGHFIKHEGDTKTLQEWSEKTGVARATIAWRVKNGWSVSDALNS